VEGAPHQQVADEVLDALALVTPVVGREVEAADLDAVEQRLLAVQAGLTLVPAAVGARALAVEGRVAAHHYVPVRAGYLRFKIHKHRLV